MTDSGQNVTDNYTKIMQGSNPEIKALLDKAEVQAVQDQVECGIDIPTDGEQRR
ncbi:MAG: hypothetical protein GY786_23745 [Proteobacteria bacterium]|nr:hypothetical protein [Pseudomonadota bacterium]